MNENIIAINIPNGLSILIMGAVGAIVWIGIRKAVLSKSGASVKSGPVQAA